MWHEPQVVPIRNGGSYDASASLLTRSSDGMPVVLTICLRKPSQLATLPPFSCRHFSMSKRGFGNLRRPSAPVEVPNFKSHEVWRWSSVPPLLCGSLGSRAASLSPHAGSTYPVL